MADYSIGVRVWISDKAEGWIGAQVVANNGDEIVFKDERENVSWVPEMAAATLTRDL